MIGGHAPHRLATGCHGKLARVSLMGAQVAGYMNMAKQAEDVAT